MFPFLHNIYFVAVFALAGRTFSAYVYDEMLAKKLMFLAAGAYAPDTNVKQQCLDKVLPVGEQWRLLNTNAKACDILESTCSFYSIRSDVRRELIIVFRGTKSKGQLFLEGWHSTQPGDQFCAGGICAGKVHSYFNHGLSILWDNLKRILSDPQAEGYTIVFTGHSLGGALASLAAFRVVLDKLTTPDRVVLYTFGQPRVGCPIFAFAHDEYVPHSFRLVHKKDIVPHLPPCTKKGMQSVVNSEGEKTTPCNPNAESNAYHHGTEIWYPNGMGPGATYRICSGEPRDEDFSCSDSLSFDPELYKKYIHDHRFYFGQRVPVFGKNGCNPNGNTTETEADGGESFQRKTVGSSQQQPPTNSAGRGPKAKNDDSNEEEGVADKLGKTVLRGAKKLLNSLINKNDK